MSSLRRPFGLALAAALAASCAPQPRAEPCNSSFDCLRHEVCLDGLCAPASPADEDLPRETLDAGAARRDGGAPSDGGRVDGGGPLDSGAVDDGGATGDGGPDAQDAGPSLQAVPQTIVVHPGVPASITLAEATGAAETFVVHEAPQHGQLVGQAPSLTYTADADALGLDQLTFAVGEGAAESRAVVRILIAAPSCATIRWGGSYDENGPYALDVDGPDGAAPFLAWCDMDAGGFTLAAKIDGRRPTFDDDAAIWTDETLSSPDLVDLERVEAKLAPFLLHPLDEARVDLATPPEAPEVRSVVLPLPRPADSLRAIFASGAHVPTNVGREAWLAAVPGAALQESCGREGFNLLRDNGSRFGRIGIIGNNEADCASPDSAIGVGLDPGDHCTLSATTTAGGLAGCVDVEREVHAFAYLYVRSRDFTALSAEPSCAAHLARGRALTGRYRVAPPGAATFVAVCDQETDGGGWMRIADVDAERDAACPEGFSYDASAAVCMRPADVQVASARFSSGGVSFAQVRALARGLQIGPTDAFEPSLTAPQLEGLYVDGLSLTVGAPGARRHVWTWAVAQQDDVVQPSPDACPCLGGVPPPPFVGSSFACEAGSPARSTTTTWLVDDVLWNGGAAPSDCDNPDAPTGFVVDLLQPAVAVEARLIREQSAAIEEIGVKRLVVDVR